MDKIRREIRRYIRIVKRNKNYQRALYLLLCCTIMVTSMWSQGHKDKLKYEALIEEKITAVSEEYEATIVQMNEAHQMELVALQEKYENVTPDEIIQKEAEFIAKVLYGAARNNSERDQRTVVWCILNRVDHHSYPNTVEGVCNQTNQWMGYNKDNPIISNLYEVALKELATWHNDYRPVNYDYIYMSWSSKEIILRDTYETAKNTHYWQAG